MPLGWGYREKLGTVPHVRVLRIQAAPQSTLPRRVLAPTNTARYPVHPIKWLSKRDQVRAGLGMCPLLVRIANMAQLAEVPDLSLALDVLQVPAAP